MLLPLIPVIGLFLLAALVLTLDAVWHKQDSRRLGWVTVCGLVLIAVLSFLFAQPAASPQLIWGGMLRHDSASFIFTILFLAGAALTTMFAMEQEALRDRGEFYAMLLTSTLGMSLMAASADIIMLYLAIETTSIPLFVMAGFMLKDEKSVEAGIKYLLFGAMTSAVMLYGFSLLYGFTGTTQLAGMAAALQSSGASTVLLVLAALLILVGFAFKISAVPFHFWAPDVYEGSPTAVAGFLSTASKAAGFAVLLRFLMAAFPENLTNIWMIVVAVLATASMFAGNLLALAQTNFKRLLAYSSIAQAGYVLIGVAADSQLGTSGAIYYLMGYLVTNLAAFGIAALVEKQVGNANISSMAGLARKSPVIGLALLVALLSLGGIPPFAGFFGKLLLFGAAIERGPILIWLAVVGIINSIIALYYYLNVLKIAWGSEPIAELTELKAKPAWSIAIVICVAAILVLGVVFAPWYGWAGAGAANLLTW
jgi:NADH-quinone oxidoreductase subunit N